MQLGLTMGGIIRQDTFTICKRLLPCTAHNPCRRTIGEGHTEWLTIIKTFECCNGAGQKMLYFVQSPTRFLRDTPCQGRITTKRLLKRGDQSLSEEHQYLGIVRLVLECNA